MSKTVGKAKNNKNTKTAKKASVKTNAKNNAKEAPKATSKSKTFLGIKIKNDANVLMICISAILIIIIVALLASAVRNRKTVINASFDVYPIDTVCTAIVREDDGKRPASGTTIVVKSSKEYKDMLSEYSYFKKLNLPEPKDYSNASYVYIYSVDSINRDGLNLGDVNVQNKNVNIEVKYDLDKSVDCVNEHVFVVRVESRDIENANYSTVED